MHIISSLNVLMFCSIKFSCKSRKDTFTTYLRMTHYLIDKKLFIFWLF